MESEKIDWGQLSFQYYKTDYNVRIHFKDGAWGKLEKSDSEMINIHMAATCLHYGQEAFEGLKAFRGKDGQVRVFRVKDNAKRMQDSCRGILMEPLPIERFEEAIAEVIKLNKRFIPPYGTGAALYIRPLLIGTSPRIGVTAATEFSFVACAMPVGPYFKEGFKPTPVAILRGYDRAAPQGTGALKVGGNYASSLVALDRAKKTGYSTVLFLDSKENKYLDECGPANFYGIKGNQYITPKSDSILPSVTNRSLMQLAEDIGMEVVRRPVLIEELVEFEEAGQVGTGAVISPISRVDDIDMNKSYIFSKDGKAGEISTKLYNKLKAIQLAEEVDIHNWTTIIDI